MNLEQVEKKLREADFFLSKMVEQEGHAFGDKEPFDFYLSAFLNAARTVDYRLVHEQKAAYKPWRDKWDSTLTPDQRTLIKFLVDDRIAEVHASGSRRNVAQEDIKVIDSDTSSILEIFAPPGTPPAIIRKPVYNFSVAGVERRAVDACKEYLQLLIRMASEFKACPSLIGSVQASDRG
jgi:hypothetical protein